MNKLRSVNTKMWSDSWFEELNPTQKLLFIYLITNGKNNMLGVYEISMRKISFETGIDKATIEKALEGFERIGKVKYVNNFIILSNFIKNQSYNTNMKKSAITTYNELPCDIKFEDLQLIDTEDVYKGFQTLCKAFGMLRKIEDEDEDENESEREKKKINTLAKSKSKFLEDLKLHKDYYSKDMLNAFYNYWTELNQSKTKMRFQLEKTFEINKRLVTWARREK